MDRFHICLELLRNSFLNKCHWVSREAVFPLRNQLILESSSLHIFWTERLCSWEAFCCTLRSCCLISPPRPIFYADELSACLKNWHFGFCGKPHSEHGWGDLQLCAAKGEAGSSAVVVMTVVKSRVWRNTILYVGEGWHVNQHLSLCFQHFQHVF